MSAPHKIIGFPPGPSTQKSDGVPWHTWRTILRGMRARAGIPHLVAYLDYLFAIVVGWSCVVTLYLIRVGHYSMEWVADPKAFARLQQMGILLALACLLIGVGMWRMKGASLWLETLLLPPRHIVPTCLCGISV